MRSIIVLGAIAALSVGASALASAALPIPLAMLEAESTLGPNYAPLRLDWTPKEARSGISRYELQQSVNGRPLTPVTLRDAKASLATLNVVPSASYRFRVREMTALGAVGDWVEGAPVRVNIEYESSENLSFVGTWARRSANAPRNWGAADKFVRVSSGNDAAATYIFTGTSVAWVASVGIGMGTADVYVDGVKAGTVDLGASERRFGKFVFTAGGLAPGVRHKLEIKALGGEVEIFGFAQLAD